jgi:DNA-binding MarR family transcriptional regulator
MERDHVDRFLDQLEGIPDLDYEVEGIVDRIAGLNKRFRRDLEVTLGEHGLSYADWKVLGSLWHEANHCSSPGELCADLELSSGAMTSRLDRLERAGLLQRRPDPDDRRGVKVDLTPEGSRAWLESTNAQARKEALVAGALTRREQVQLNTLLRKLMLELDRVDAAGPAEAAAPAA